MNSRPCPRWGGNLQGFLPASVQDHGQGWQTRGSWPVTFHPFNPPVGITDWINAATNYGADPSGALDSTAQLGNAITAAVKSGAPVYIPAGTYTISDTLNWQHSGLTVIGAGKQSTTIRCTAANTQIVQLAGQHQWIEGIGFIYSAQQVSASTSAIAVAFGDNTVGSCFESTFRQLYVQYANTGLSVDPACTAKAGLFSCTLADIHIVNSSRAAVDLQGAAGSGNANCTGCVFSNVYVNNNFTGSDTNFSFVPVNFKAWDEMVINQLNIEHSQVFSGPALQFSSVGSASISALHFEHLEQSGTPGFPLIRAGTGTGSLDVRGLTIRFCTFTGTSYNAVIDFSVGVTGCTVLIDGFNGPPDGGYNAVSPWVDWASTSGNSVQVASIAADQQTQDSVNAGTNDRLQLPSAITPYTGGFTSFPTGGSANLLNSTSGNSTVMVAGTFYYAALYVPFTVTLAGVIACTGNVGGADNWIAALWAGTGGTALATSALAGTAAPAANTKFKLPFTAAVELQGPGVYIIGVQSNGITARLLTFPNAVEGFVTGSVAGAFGTVPSLTPAGSYSANVGPMVTTY